ncbi:MAG: hypothetical protein ACLU80_13590 [Dorea sp.]
MATSSAVATAEVGSIAAMTGIVQINHYAIGPDKKDWSVYVRRSLGCDDEKPVPASAALWTTI